MLAKWKLKKQAKKNLLAESRTIEELENAAFQAYESWNDMLRNKNQIKILEASNKDELSELWDQFQVKNNGMRRLNCISDLSSKEFSVDNGIFYLKIEFTEFVLNDDSTLEEYNHALALSDKLDNKLRELKRNRK